MDYVLNDLCFFKQGIKRSVINISGKHLNTIYLIDPRRIILGLAPGPVHT